MEILYIVTAVLFILCPRASAVAADISCTALKNVVIRALLPMSVLSTLIANSGLLSAFGVRLSRGWLWRRLSLSHALLPSVLTGLISGLPCGAMEIQRLLDKGCITKKEAGKAMALCSLPSPAFVITVASPSVKVGAVRYALLLLTAYIVSSLFHSIRSEGESEARKMTLPKAISSASGSMIAVSASIVFFTAVTCLASSLVPLTKWWAVLFEMGSGVIFADGSPFFTSLALGWCGLSAMSQLRCVASGVPIAPYLVTRIVSAAVLLLVKVV